MNQRIVKFPNDYKGYGFTKGAQRGEDYTEPISELMDEGHKNEEVPSIYQGGHKGL